MSEQIQKPETKLDSGYSGANFSELGMGGAPLDTLKKLVNFLNNDHNGKKMMQNFANEIINSDKKEKSTQIVNNGQTDTEKENGLGSVHIKGI